MRNCYRRNTRFRATTRYMCMTSNFYFVTSLVVGVRCDHLRHQFICILQTVFFGARRSCHLQNNISLLHIRDELDPMQTKQNFDVCLHIRHWKFSSVYTWRMQK